MDSELLTCLLKFIEYFPDHLSALSHTLLRFFWTTFVETAVYSTSIQSFGEEKFPVLFFFACSPFESNWCLILTLIQCGILFFRNHNVDVSVAVSADSGLITPIVFNADKKARKNAFN